MSKSRSRIAMGLLTIAVFACSDADPFEPPIVPQRLPYYGDSCDGLTEAQCAAVMRTISMLRDSPDPGCAGLGLDLLMHNARDEIRFSWNAGHGQTKFAENHEYHANPIILGPNAFATAEDLFMTMAHEEAHHLGHGDGPGGAESFAYRCWQIYNDPSYINRLPERTEEWLKQPASGSSSDWDRARPQLHNLTACSM